VSDDRTLQKAEATLAELSTPNHALPLGPLAPIVEGAFGAMKKNEWIVCGPRERVGAVLRGASPDRLIDGNAGARPYKIAPVSDAPGNRALHAVGLALGSEAPVLCILGSASAASGAFHEALNAAVLTDAPVTFLVATTPITDDAPVGRQLAASPLDLAQAHGLSSSAAKPTVKDVKSAVTKARKLAKPSLIHVQLEL
jgi:TPP-dependent pyruvate/acetoin dehydrogenase alpha subunit